MARKTKIDKLVERTATELGAVQRRETWALTSSERRSVIGNTTLGAARVARGKGPGGASGRVEQAWARAQSRLEGELSAAVQMQRQEQQEQAAARVARRARKWF